MKAVALTAPDEVKVLQIPEPIPQDEDILLKVELVGLCGSDLNSYRGMNPLVSYPRAGSFPVDRVITSVVHLNDAPEALVRWAAHPASVTKIVVEI